MKGALWLLIGLQLRGWLRYAFRRLATVKGAILAAVGLLVFVPWIGTLVWRGPAGQPADPTWIRAFGPPALAGYCLLNLLLTSGENALYFIPAEIGFLFPAPLYRRQLVAYKLASSALVGVPTALLMAGLFYAQAGTFLSGLLGIGLILTFVHLFAACVQLLVAAMGAQLFRRGKRLVASTAVLAGITAAGVVRWHGGPEVTQVFLAAVPETPAWKVAMQPLSWFIEVFLARQFWPDLALFLSLGVLINLILLAAVFTLDTLSLESLAVSSSRFYTRMQRLRGRQVEQEVNEEHGYLLVIPDLPWWGGIGPLLWRQSTTALRQPGRLALAALPFAFLLVGPLLSTGEESANVSHAVPLLVFGTLWVSIFLTALVPYDFRGDLDRMAMLKTLPLPPWRLVLGQVATPVVVVSCLQAAALLVLHFLLPRPDIYTWAALGFVVPFNFLLFAQENLLFLLFPMRVVATNPGDFQFLGKNFLILLARMLGLALAVAGAGAAGFLAYLLGGLGLGFAAAWLFLAASGAALVPLVGLAFTAFDVTADAPA